VNFEILAAVTMKYVVFRDVRTCRPIGIHQHFEGLSYLHLQGRLFSTLNCGSSRFPLKVCEFLWTTQLHAQQDSIIIRNYRNWLFYFCNFLFCF